MSNLYRSPDHKINAFADALVILSVAVRQHPELFVNQMPRTTYSGEPDWEETGIEPQMHLDFWAYNDAEMSEAKALLSSVARLANGRLDKYATDYDIGFELRIRDAIAIRVTQSRQQVCAKVVVGTKKVTRTRVITEAVTEEYEDEIEDVMWVCPDSLLATTQEV